jgi:hypothetical protein
VVEWASVGPFALEGSPYIADVPALSSLFRRSYAGYSILVLLLSMSRRGPS